MELRSPVHCCVLCGPAGVPDSGGSAHENARITAGIACDDDNALQDQRIECTLRTRRSEQHD